MEEQIINWERKLTIDEFNNLKDCMKDNGGEYYFSNMRGIVNYEPTENEVLNNIERLLIKGNTNGAGSDRWMYLLYDTAFNIFTHSMLSRCFINEDRINKTLYDKIFGFPDQKQFYFLICTNRENCLYMFDISTAENIMKYPEGKYAKLVAEIKEDNKMTKLQELVEKYVAI